VKNYFLFAYYAAGIRIGDFMQLQWKNIVKDTLIYNMDKTASAHEVVLIPKAKAILKLYQTKNTNSENYIFPILKNELLKADKLKLNSAISSKNAVINLNLKKIALKAKINKNLTFHISRHSFADILRQQDVSIYDIKDLLGHSDIKITQNYLKSFDRDSANKAHSKAVL
jgi:integrase